MPGDTGACNRLILNQNQRCVRIMPMAEHGNYSLLWYIHANIVFPLPLKKNKGSIDLL